MANLPIGAARMASALCRMAVVLLPTYGFGADYLPLALGNKWQLNSPNTTTAVTATVTSVEQYGTTTKARVDITSPWMQYAMLLKSTTTGIELEGIALPAVRFRFADPVMYFPASGVAGQSWNSSGTVTTLLSTADTLKAPAGTFTGVRRFKIVSPDGSTQWWGLAPNVGFVEFGTGTGAFVAQTYVSSPTPATALSVTAASRNCPLVGIDANPAANGNFSEAGKDAALSFAKTNGARVMHISTSWAELETSPNVYNLTALKAAVARSAKYGLDAVATIKTINTGGVTMPADLAGKAWNDPVVLSRFRALLAQVVPVLGARVRWLEFGNEVDVLLSTQSGAIAPYAEFVQSASTYTATLRSDLSVGLVFSGDSYRLNDFVFRVLAPYCNHIAFTYYATRPNPTTANPAIQRDAADVPFDMDEFYRAAAGKTLLFTEVGYASATSIGSSVDAQKGFYSAIFDSLRRSGGNVTAVNMFLMSDIPLSIASVDPSVASYTSWFQTLGLFDLTGVAKPAWDVFRTQATDFTISGRCF